MWEGNKKINMQSADENGEEIGECSKNPALNSISTIDWLKKRYSKTAKLQYLNNPTQLKQHFSIFNVFKVRILQGKRINVYF